MSSLIEQIEAVSRFPDSKIRAKALAPILGISEAALSSQRRRRSGPPAVMRQGCRPVYDRDEVVTWLQAQLERNSRWVPSQVTPDLSPDDAP